MSYKRTLPISITAATAILIVLQYFFKVPELKAAGSELLLWAVLLVAFALLLGFVFAIRANIYYVVRRTPGRWYYSLWTLIVAGVTSAIGLINGASDPTFQWIFQNVLTTLYTTMVATTGFFITSAAYRAFRARTLDAALLLATGLLVVLRNTPLAVAGWSGFTTLGNWVMDVLVNAGMRGITIGAAVGAIAMGLRTILGYEKGYLGG